MRNYALFFVFALSGTFAFGCGGEKKTEPTKTKGTQPEPKIAEKDREASPAPTGSSKSLLVATSEFTADEKGLYTVPDAAVLLILGKQGAKWKTERIEDRESNVFHKALPYKNEGILTLGGNEAMLKLWSKKDGKWTAETLWHKKFGGKQNRLRDFELADFDGDGNDELAIATHDQGIVAVVWKKDGKWVPEEIDHKADTFVHEIEIGDLDGDGKLEIYATPSQPNTVSGKDQGGKVVKYAWDGRGFARSEVISLATRHIKEILVADVDGDKKQELYAAVEAEVDGATLKKPVEIRRFDYEKGKFKESLVTTLRDRFCRFLTAGDIDSDGKKELVAAAFSSGVWVIEKTAAGYAKECIDAKSGGFEHAAFITDLDEDGKEELYVADDRSGTIKKYSHDQDGYTSEILSRRPVPAQAMVWNLTDANIQ